MSPIDYDLIVGEGVVYGETIQEPGRYRISSESAISRVPYRVICTDLTRINGLRVKPGTLRHPRSPPNRWRG